MDSHNTHNISYKLHALHFHFWDCDLILKIMVSTNTVCNSLSHAKKHKIKKVDLSQAHAKKHKIKKVESSSCKSLRRLF